MFGKAGLVFTMILALPLSAGAQEIISGKFAGWADIDRSGRLASFAPDRPAHPGLVEALQHELLQMAFVPAHRDSGPIPIRTHVNGEYTLQAQGDEYVLHVERVNAGPKVLLTDLPKPPRRLAALNESGWARVVFTVGTDGKARDVTIEAAEGPSEIRRNVRESIMRWRFEPEMIDGAPVETRLRQDFIFAKSETSVELPACPPDNDGRVLAPGQTACETVETRLRAVGTGSIEVP